MTAVNEEPELVTAGGAAGLGRPLVWQRAYARRLAALDLVVVVLAVGVAQWLRFGSLPGTAHTFAVYSMVSVNIAASWMLALSISRARSPRVIGSGAAEYRRVCLATLSVFGGVAIISMLFKLQIARGYLAIAFLTGLAGLIVIRWVTRRILASALNNPHRHIARLLVVGNTADFRDLHSVIQQEVKAPGTSASRRSRRGWPTARSAVPDNVRLLDSRRSDLARATDHDEAARPRSLEINKDPGDPAADVEHVRIRFLSRIRAWMVIPVVDFALMVLPILWRPTQVNATVTMAVIATLLLTGGGRYTARLHLSVLDELPSIVGRLLIAVAIVSAVIVYRWSDAAVIMFLQTALQAATLVILGRLVTTRLIATARRRGITTHRTVLIGGGPVAAELGRILAQHREYGLKLVGFVDDGDRCPAEEFLPRLGRLADLDMAVLTTGADNLLVADGSFQERALIDAVRTEACRNTDLLVVPRMHHFHTLTGVADHIGSIPIMRIDNPNLRGPARLIKRGFDIVVTVMALIVLLPVLATAALAVRIEGGPGIIFRQVRVGRQGKHFELFKFRTMRPANELESQTQWSVASDSRVGPVGRLLRRTSIDELPQLWNILRGDMTVVGPRPERPHFVEQFSTEIDRYAHRHRVQVGLTGFAQVSGLRGDTSIADRARYDNFYIENWSLWLDIKIILRTFREVVFYRER